MYTVLVAAAAVAQVIAREAAFTLGFRQPSHHHTYWYFSN